jgi:UDP-glucuronate 4-epimerase
MSLLVTGAAGFIGYHLCQHLLARGENVIGIDNLNTYYSVELKRSRLARLQDKKNFTFRLADISDQAAITALAHENRGITHIVNLAAQAGVRHSLTHPRDYVRANLTGFVEILELARHLPNFQLLVYASSSSVYGANSKLPFSVDDRVDTPVSLYAASKKANEVMAYSYSHLYKIPAIGLRFFTVYGPWGRPDMAAFIFTRSILAGEPIPVFNHGKMRRDFTYIDDIIAGLLSCVGKSAADLGSVPHRLYNLGNHRSEDLMKFIKLIEEQCGRPANIVFGPMQMGDVRETYADIEATTRDLGFYPKTSIEAGIPRFVQWYREYYSE